MSEPHAGDDAQFLEARDIGQAEAFDVDDPVAGSPNVRSSAD